MVIRHPILKMEVTVKPSYEPNKGMIVVGSGQLKPYINSRVKVLIFRKK